MLQRLPLARQIFGLALLSSVITALCLVALALRGPPPVPAPTDIAVVAATLRTGATRSGPDRPMRVAEVTTRPDVPPSYRADAVLMRRIATAFDLAPDAVVAAVEPGATVSPAQNEVFGRLFVAVPLPDGGWRQVATQPGSTARRWWLVTLLAIAATLTISAAIAALVARSITGPLTRLADAAADATAGRRWQFAETQVAPEIAGLSAALGGFDRRYRDHLTRQVHLLAAIAHDLGTPLTRLAFRVEGLPEAQRAAAQADIDAMRALITDSLSLARSDMARREPIDLADMVQSIAADAHAAGEQVIAVTPAALPLGGEPVALRRMIQNLVDNAVRHAGSCRVELLADGGQAIIRVIDDGPGFPPDLLPYLREPFIQGGMAHGASGGGLGLSIVAAIAERHGGSLALANRPGGGACATVSIPDGQA